MKCAVCNEQTLGHWTGLCYLHRKYSEQIAGPYFETLYDLLYWKATFLKEWDELGYGKIIVSCSPHVEVQMYSAHIQIIKDRIQEQLKLDKADLSSYENLVKTCAYRYSALSGCSFEELYNEGMLQLSVLECRLDPRLDPKIVSAWVKKSIMGRLINYSTKVTVVIDPPEGDAPDDAEEMLIVAEEGKMGMDAVAKLITQLTPLQRNILSNLFKDEPRTQTQLAKTNKVTQSTIAYHLKVIYGKAEGLGYDYHRKEEAV